MIRNSVKILPIITIIIFTGCVATHHSTEKQKAWKPEFKVLSGINQGGIVENTYLEQIPNTSVDAFTGATRIGVNAGAHVVIPLWVNAVETGIDFMRNSQTFTYNDDQNAYSGSLKAGVSQLMWPLTYNVGLFRKSNANGLLQIKIGHVLQYNMVSLEKSGNNLPDNSINKFSNGITLGFSAMPFSLRNDAGLGFFVDLYRGSQIFEDFYNLKSFDTPASAYWKAGIIYQF